MKSCLPVVAVLSVLSLGSLLVAQQGPFAPPALPASSQPTSRPARPPMTVDSPPDLERAMKMMDRQIKTITAQLDNKAMDGPTLTAVNSLQVYTALAKSALPDSVGEEIGDAKKKAIADYRQRIIALIRAELLLEEAILRDDRVAAHVALADLAQQRKDGHSAYGVDDDRRH